jgi:hypothetical protein
MQNRPIKSTKELVDVNRKCLYSPLAERHALRSGMINRAANCLEMICADFLAGASLDGINPDLLLQSQRRFFRFLNPEQQRTFLAGPETIATRTIFRKPAPFGRIAGSMRNCTRATLQRDG